MSRGTPAIVDSRLLKWARETSGVKRKDAAKSAGVHLDRIIRWEEGKDSPTVNQLRKLALKYKRPLAVFYLPEPPKEFEPMHDYRRLPEYKAREQSVSLRFGIRQALLKRDVALALYEQLKERPPEFKYATTLKADPERAGRDLRELLNIDFPIQKQWSNPSQAFNHWRERLEHQGILVLQVSGVEESEMLGMSIGGSPMPVIALNNRLHPHGRIFSMLHELVHIALKTVGLCDFNEIRHTGSNEQITEVFCNRVAGATLVPQNDLLSEQIVTDHTGVKWEEFELKVLSRRFRASREVILRRLLINNLTTKAFYEKKRSEWLKEKQEDKGKRVWRVEKHKQVLLNSGKLYTGLILRAYDSEVITGSDVSEYLDMKLKHLFNLRQAIYPAYHRTT